MVECIEMRVREKISLIEVLNELVKGGVEIVGKEEEEEEMKEVLMELEEEGNKHVEEEMEGKEGGEKEEEAKREWEELSEKARNFVWVLEKMKNRREGKKGGTLKMSKRKEEEMEKKEAEMEKKVEEEKNKKEEAEQRNRELEAQIERMKQEMEQMKKESTLTVPKSTDAPISSGPITSLDETSVTFPLTDGIKRDGNVILRTGADREDRNCFIGGPMTSV